MAKTNKDSQITLTVRRVLVAGKNTGFPSVVLQFTDDLIQHATVGEYSDLTKAERVAESLREQFSVD